MKASLKKLILFSSIILTGCSTKVVEKPVYIEKPVVVEKPVYIKPSIPELPKRPKLKKVKFEKIGEYYCTTKEGAKQLLKNIYMLDNYSRELETIINSIQEQAECSGSGC